MSAKQALPTLPRGILVYLAAQGGSVHNDPGGTSPMHYPLCISFNHHVLGYLSDLPITLIYKIDMVAFCIVLELQLQYTKHIESSPLIMVIYLYLF